MPLTKDHTEDIINYLKTHPSPLERSQKAILKALNISQATFWRNIGILIGNGKIEVKRFATAKIYELSD